MLLSTNRWLKFAYRAMITGLPLTTYNTYNDVSFHAPVNINPYSTYVNYKLTIDEFDYINKYLYKNTNFTMSIMSIEEKANPKYDYYVSVNMYNCTSPMFNVVTNQPITRCEINTYVKDQYGNYGTLIMDYASNYLSMDPENIFKLPGKAKFTTVECDQNIDTQLSKAEYFYASSICPICDYGNLKSSVDFKAETDNFDFSLKYNVYNDDMRFRLNRNLIDYTDNIYYNNGICDKLYYDTTLTRADIREIDAYNVSFKFKDLVFSKPESVFYFKNNINFVGSLWNNLYAVE